MAEILHQLRLVVYPIIYKVLAPSQVVVSRISAINSMNHILMFLCFQGFPALCYVGSNLTGWAVIQVPGPRCPAFFKCPANVSKITRSHLSQWQIL